MNSRIQTTFAALAGLLLVTALSTAIFWTLALSRHPSTPAASPASTGGDERLYAGLPDATRYGHPVIILTNAAYLTGYCEARRNPAWVGFSLNSITVGSLGKRPSKFFTDTRTRSATHQDYTNSGYDRGHMAPNYAIGTRYGHEAQRETFYMSNISPQTRELNQMWWRVLEEKEANDFAVRLERVWVVTGPMFSGEVKKLKGGVDVPTAFYRIILDEENGQPRALAFIAPQTVTGNEPLSQFLTSVREVERQTGLDFHPALSKEAQDRIEMPSATRLW
ncbi:MAG: DNA/RNA non-specific endonuclease [Verrucomicrobia bacterium]|nr:DNA/RNA non-specific endonuclease [Verrucomicrobiota bacterium]